MKKVLASFMAVGLMASVANAELIGLRWVDTPGAAQHEGAGTVEVYLHMQGTAAFNGDIGGLLFTFRGANAATPVPENLVFSNYQSSIPTWSGAGQEGSGPNTQFVVGGLQVLSGPGDFVLGTFDVSFTGPADNSIKAFSAAIPQDPAGLITGAGAKLAWSTVNSVQHGSYYGYDAVAFAPGAFGNPGWGTKGGQTANPLFISKIVPEPTSLALVALGGFALLRRRN